MIKYLCTTCGKILATDEIVYLCPECGKTDAGTSFQKGNLLVEPDLEKISAFLAREKTIDPLRFYPFAIDFHDSFAAGGTPLVKPARLNREFGFGSLFCKIESANPSGSLKDRASLLVAAQARHYHVNRIVLASTGNAGAAMSCAGAALGLETILFVPETAPVEKLAQSLFYGARVIPVKGTYDDAYAMSIEYTMAFGGINRNTGYNPMTTEGKKSAAIEIINQLNGDVPDLVYIPAGDGVVYTGVCKGFEDLMKLGLIDRLPRCIAVQAEGSNAIYRSFGKSAHVILKKTETIADSISVRSPACGEPALQYLKKTGGWAAEVSDREILEAQKELSEKGGFFVEPSSASAFAGLLKDKSAKTITGNEIIVLLLTGSGFKDMKAVLNTIKIPEAIDCSLEAVLNLPPY